MLRELGDILASQSRVGGWLETEEPRELAKYFRSAECGTSAAVKYEVWQRFQKPAMESARKPFFELRYPDDVQRHPRYVPPDQRVEWLPQQTAPSGNVL